MSFMDKLRALLAEDDESGEGVGEAEIEGDEGAEVEGDEGAEVEGTPGDVAEDTPEVAELRQQVSRQAAEIESLRNQVAVLGGEVDEGAENASDVVEVADDVESEEYLAAFNSDYAERQAHLAEITKG